jgi:hypothetical protein
MTRLSHCLKTNKAPEGNPGACLEKIRRSLAVRWPYQGFYKSLGLVTQALLVPVKLHALAALVLGDLGFTFLFD